MLEHATRSTAACAAPDFSAKSSEMGDCAVETQLHHVIGFVFCVFQLKVAFVEKWERG